MRQALNPELRLGFAPIEQVELNVNCRDEIIPILRALQQIYGEPKLRRQILGLVAEDVNQGTSSELGRPGPAWPGLLADRGAGGGASGLQLGLRQAARFGGAASESALAYGDWG